MLVSRFVGGFSGVFLPAITYLMHSGYAAQGVDFKDSDVVVSAERRYCRLATSTTRPAAPGAIADLGYGLGPHNVRAACHTTHLLSSGGKAHVPVVRPVHVEH
jgi:hypothetical protein